jgi:hypothetical protein
MLISPKLVSINRRDQTASGKQYQKKSSRDIEENDACRDALRLQIGDLRPLFLVASGGIDPVKVAGNQYGYGRTA